MSISHDKIKLQVLVEWTYAPHFILVASPFLRIATIELLVHIGNGRNSLK
jgi:hypothetical protein